MKKLLSILKSVLHYSKLATSFLLILSFTFASLAPLPVFADADNGIVEEEIDKDGNLVKGCVKTAIIGENHEFCSEENNPGGIVLELVASILDILTVGVGILGVIAISWAGITYLTAGGNEEKVRTAKRRLVEIVIGLAAYALLFGFLKWLLPGFSGI